MKIAVIVASALALTIGASISWAGETPSQPGAEVYFVNIQDGDVFSGPVKINFGLSGMGVAPAGVEMEGTGHHHLFVNRAPFGEGPDGAEEADYNIPADENHLHFGGGQTETTIELPPGQHTLQLVLGDLAHIPHDPPVVSEVVTITVE